MLAVVSEDVASESTENIAVADNPTVVCRRLPRETPQMSAQTLGPKLLETIESVAYISVVCSGSVFIDIFVVAW